MNPPVEKSTAGPGEIANVPLPHQIFNAQLKNRDGEKSGYTIDWKTSAGAYLIASNDSHVSLDAKM